MPDPTYRVGRKLGHTVYQQCGPDPDDSDLFLFDAGSRELAAELVADPLPPETMLALSAELTVTAQETITRAIARHRAT